MIPVAVITGPVGVGKSTVLLEASALLISAGVPHATIELEDIACFWGPNPSREGRTRRHVAFRNLASLWANYSAAGADRLLLSLLMEERSDLTQLRVRGDTECPPHGCPTAGAAVGDRGPRALEGEDDP